MGIGQLIWKISVALYLIINGIMGFSKNGGDYHYILTTTMKFPAIIATIVAVVSFIAGICIALNLFRVEVSFLPNLVLVIAIVWIVYVIIEIVAYLRSGFDLEKFQRLAVHLMVLGSMIIATGRFGDD